MFMLFCLIQFLERLRYFEEETERRRAELKETLDQKTRELYEKKLAGQFKICDKMDEDAMDPMLGTVVKQLEKIAKYDSHLAKKLSRVTFYPIKGVKTQTGVGHWRALTLCGMLSNQ